MAWVRIDDEFYLHPKVVAVGPLGLALQVAALCYSNRYLTDGFIPKRVVKHLLDYETLAVGNEDVTWQMVVGLLLDAGLWEECEDGYAIHDFTQYQPSRESVAAKQAQKVAAGQAGGRATAQANAQAKGVAKSKPVPVPVPDPLSSSDPLDRVPPAPADCRAAFFRGRKSNEWVAAVIDRWQRPLSREQRRHLGGLLRRYKHGQRVWDAAESSKDAEDPVQFMERLLNDGGANRRTGERATSGHHGGDDVGGADEHPASPFAGMGRQAGSSGGET